VADAQGRKNIVKSLTSVSASPEQLKITRRLRPGPELIRGAAGSGKTTTAVLKLKILILWVISRRKGEKDGPPVRALVLTFNKTLRGYVENLVNENTPNGNLEVVVDTFGRWAARTLGWPDIYEGSHIEALCAAQSARLGLSTAFLRSEAEYAIGRFLPENIEEYLTCRRDGKGAAPRVERPTRQVIVDEIIRPYSAYKTARKQMDWNDIAVTMAKNKHYDYDIVIVDESQDFSANQIRAIVKQCGAEGACSFVIDTAQRIYTGGFTWVEVGIVIRPENSHRLTVNYRNTPEIARLAASLISCVPLDDDGTPPLLVDLRGDAKPKLLRGTYPQQLDWAINYVKENVDLSKESVAFLHPLGWLRDVKKRLDAEGLGFVEITQKRDWPTGNENIALCTLHSSKGLDFDHAIIIGISAETLPDGEFDVGDDRLEHACRLLSMAIARARKNVVLGYSPSEPSAIIDRLDKSVLEEINWDE
jgi:superfamily I DNA/RNA helicase